MYTTYICKKNLSRCLTKLIHIEQVQVLISFRYKVVTKRY